MRTLLLILLIILIIGGLPQMPYMTTRGWGYFPSGGLLLLLILILLLSGRFGW